MWTEEIAVKGMFDFDYSLQRLAYDQLISLNKEERWVQLPIRIGNTKHIVKVQALGTTQEPKFEIKSKSEKEKDILIEKIKALFQWDKPLEDIHNHFLQTNLAPLFEKFPGTPIVKDIDYFDSIVKIIIHQQLNMKFAYTLSARFMQNFGEEMDGVWFHPTPEAVANLDYEDLRKLQFSQRKAEYVIDTSRLIVEGKLDLDKLAGEPDEEVLQSLTKIRGIGAWSAENWLLFGVGRNNLLPAADIGIQNALKKYLDLEGKPHKDEIYKMGEEWSPYRSYAALTLWRSIED